MPESDVRKDQEAVGILDQGRGQFLSRRDDQDAKEDNKPKRQILQEQCDVP